MPDLDLLRSIGTVKQFRKDEVVFMEDGEGESMYVALKGVFGVYVNSFVDFPVRVAGIAQGGFFGEMSVIDGWPRSATVVAEEDGTALVIGKKDFAMLLEKSPDIAESILKTLHARADATAEAARERGKYAAPAASLPENRSGDVKSIIQIMNALATQIRQTNSLLYDSAASSSAESLAETVPQKGVVTLLPEGFVPHNIIDTNDNSDMLMERKVTCPYCNKKFTTYIPQTANLVQERTNPDGRVIYKGFNILLYTNVICPNCNYADAFKEFSRFKQAPEKTLFIGNQFKNTESFAGFSNPRNRSVDEAILSYYLALRCLRRVTNSPLRYAKAWIRLYWMYCDLGETEFAKQAARKTIDSYSAYLDKKDASLSQYDEMRMHVMLGEMSAAIDEPRQARGYFEAAVRLGRNISAARELVEESLKRYNELK